jgi:putative polysaccharide biosynthesis protein
MTSQLIGALPVLPAACTESASNADIREFRENLKWVRRRRKGFMRLLRYVVLRRLPISVAMFYVWRRLSIFVAMFYACVGLRRYARGVKQQYGIGLSQQFRDLCADHLSGRITHHTFYLYQLYLADRRRERNRYLSFWQIFPMLHYFTDCTKCEDYPLLRSKHLFARRCSEIGLPFLPLVAEFAEGKMILCSPSREATLPDVDLFSKPSEYWCGIGANLWICKASGKYVNPISGEAFDKESLIRKLCAESKSGRIVLQERVANHPSLVGTLTTGALATVRLVSCRTPSGSVDLLPPVIRMPYGKAIVDNVGQGGLAAPVDIATGKICGPAIRKDKNLGISTVEKHPDTGVGFVGVQLPFWEAALGLAVQAHLAFPSLHFVGWDIALLRDGPIVLEGNAWWDSDVTVLPHRLSLSDTQFIPYCNHHFKRSRAVSCP